MRIPSTVDAALHCCIALYWLEGERVSAPELARRFGLPPEYTRKTMKRLAQDGIVTSAPGKGGGFALSDPEGGTTALAVLESITGPLQVRTSLRYSHQGLGESAIADPIQDGIDCFVVAAMRGAVSNFRAELTALTVERLAQGMANGGAIPSPELATRTRRRPARRFPEGETDYEMLLEEEAASEVLEPRSDCLKGKRR